MLNAEEMNRKCRLGPGKGFGGCRGAGSRGDAVRAGALCGATPSRVTKKGKKSENHSNCEAKGPTILTPHGVVQHPTSEEIDPMQLS